MSIKVDEKNVDVIARRAGEKKLHELVGRRQAKEHELSEATTRYMELRQSRQRSRVALEAEALLSEQPVKAAATVADLQNLQHEIEILNEAIAQQSKLLDTLNGKFSLGVCEANKDTYVAIEKRIARAVKELALANEAEVLFFRQLQDAGCTSITFRPMRINAVGLASDNQSVAAFHAREVAEFLPEAVV